MFGIASAPPNPTSAAGMYKVIRNSGMVAPSHLMVRADAAVLKRIMMCGWKIIPNDSTTIRPNHIPGVKNP